jgi:hypothetical protein
VTEIEQPGTEAVDKDDQRGRATPYNQRRDHSGPSEERSLEPEIIKRTPPFRPATSVQFDFYG